MSQQQALNRLPDASMAKKIITHIINTLRPDFTELDKEIAEYEEMRLAELSPEDRKRLLAME